MVLHKISQKGDICAVSLHSSDSVVQIAHAASVRRKCVDDQIPNGKVEQATYVFLVSANKIYRVVVHFTDYVYISSCFEGGEKLVVLFKTSVKPDAIDAIGLGNI